jgi:hypothetical protein
MVKIKYLGILLVCLFFTVSILTVSNNVKQNFIQNDDNSVLIDNLRIADNGMSLNYSKIWQNASSAYRLFDNVKFEVNTSDFVGVNKTIMQFELNNNSVREYQMEWVSGTDNFTYIYTPEYDVPLGFHNISFIITDASGVQLNSQMTKTNITIISNYLGNLNKNDYARNEQVYGELIVNNFGSYNFGWQVTIVDNDTENQAFYDNIFDIGNNLSSFYFNIDERFQIPDHVYYVKVNISDSLSGKIGAAYLPFKVNNSVPEIIGSSVDFSHSILKREEECKVSLNVSDIDPLTTPENITVTLKLINSLGEELSPIILDNNGDWTFSGTFKVAKNQPIGLYQARLQAEDSYAGIGIYTTTLNITNNSPEIHGFWINGLTTQEQISIKYGDNLVFTFNVSDLENTYPKYVTVSLLNEENNWFNITRMYNPGSEIVIRSEDLVSGVWYVYISATDSDGATTYITSDYGAGPKEVRIIPDELSGILSWITLFVGLGFGLLIGIAISYKIMKSRLNLPQKPAKKKEVPSDKKSKKEKPSKQIEEKETLDEEPEEPEKEITEPQRKIKRKLA